MVAVTRTGPAPSAKHLRHWEAVCRFIDAQPYRAVWYPYPFGEGDPPMTTRLFKRMAQFGLVRHGEDCCWKLTQRWQQIMRRLWLGVAPEDVPPLLLAPGQDEPFLVDLGVDTFYITLKADDLPTWIVTQCTDLKALAQTRDTSVETPWLWFGAPLSIQKSGVGTKEHDRGASWGYILRNDDVMLLLRKTALNGIIGSVRLSAHALWTYGPRGALDRMKRALRWMWGDPKVFKTLEYQVSQIHLCIDVAHFVPKPDDLNRLVTRARVVQVHVPSDDEEAGVASAWDGDEDGLDAWDEPDVPDDWAAVPLDDDLDAFDEDDEAEDEDEETDPPEGEQLAEHEGASIHLWGQRASGMTFAQKGALSVIFYDKALQERQAGIKLAWSRRIHEAGGWDGRSPLTRIEARFKREILRELALAFGGKSARWADDPWEILDHLHDLWAYFAGVPPEQDHVPDVTGLGWMRLTLRDADDTRKRRWQTDPLWHLVQRAPFSTLPPVMLKRQKQHHHDLDAIDAEIYGFFKLRAAHRGEYLGHTVTLSQELHAFHDRMEEIDMDKGRDFAEEVREKARLLGKPVPMRPLSTLPPLSERPKQTRKA